MREIKFRAITMDEITGEESFITSDDLGLSQFWYSYYESTNITGSTLGQYTGLKDKNGKEIYEGDIVHVVYSKEDRKFMGKDGDYIGKIKWIDDEPGLMIEQVNHPGADTLFESDKKCEVIGNIWEHPELLK